VDWVECLTLSGVAGGGDGLLIETHPDPSVAKSDGKQAVVLSEFGSLMEKTRRVAEAVGRTIPTPHTLAAVAR
jgi:2-dehydro-3-deoxyphosphooctonate aldolase (KDO 8-P synthase)